MALTNGFIVIADFLCIFVYIYFQISNMKYYILSCGIQTCPTAW